MPRSSAKPKNEVARAEWDFSALVASIRSLHERRAALAARAVNTTLTLRNWLIGQYIRHYELHGADRAAYGSNLFEQLSSTLDARGHVRYHPRELRRCREFFDAYPQIRGTVSPEFKKLASGPSEMRELGEGGEIGGTASPEWAIPPSKLLASLSYSHFVELLPITDPLKRAFYEIECIRGNWSVRALKRQIATLYFERSGLSQDKKKLAAMVQAGAEAAQPRLAIRDPYVFEFLGLKGQDAVEEADLEAALVDNLREFLLELGHGFCLEAQQKSIVIGKTRGFVDLVFYHRILKCHVLVELKVDEFTHENIGQLNTYVSWYRKNMMAEGDNAPVGLLLCTDKDHALVEYATASMDNRLFVSKYQLELPKKEELERFLVEKRREISGELA